ncbi:hypothetical protein Tcan_15497 [Toxocara canis]|uniref:Uncharacterized protein n=1 Tax=Toxocara canis TaxID=6265 RepID=A0A0B2VNR4_TOXCA|nr:hypothetical protein Tcan_15497 [Toxocara canis]
MVIISGHKGNYEVRKNGSKYHRSHSKSSYGSYNGGRRTSRRHSYHKHRKPRPGIISVGKRRPRTRRAMREEQKRKKKQQPEISIVELIGREILHMNIEAKHPNKDPKKVDRLVAFKRIDRHQKNDKNWLHHLMSENDSKKIDLKKSVCYCYHLLTAANHRWISSEERRLKCSQMVVFFFLELWMVFDTKWGGGHR